MPLHESPECATILTRRSCRLCDISLMCAQQVDNVLALERFDRTRPRSPEVSANAFILGRRLMGRPWIEVHRQNLRLSQIMSHRQNELVNKSIEGESDS